MLADGGAVTKEPKLADVFVRPGDVYLGVGNIRVSTILGSCVAIVARHQSRKIGGMCHFMLPERALRSGQAPGLAGRYGDEAAAILIQRIEASGCSLRHFTFYLYGAGSMLGLRPSPEGVLRAPVHQRNAQQAVALAEKHRLKVSQSCLGGQGHRRVLLDLAMGTATVEFTPVWPVQRPTVQRHRMA